MNTDDCEDDSEAELVKIEREALARYPGRFGDSQIQTILKDWFPKLREKAKEKGLDSFDYELTISETEKLLEDIQWALSAYRKRSYDIWVSDEKEKKNLKKNEEENRGTLWYAPSHWEVNYQREDWTQVSSADRGSLENALATYLKKDCLQHNLIEWAAINALLFDEIARMMDGIKSGVAFGEINWAYTIAGGNPDKLAWGKIKLGLFAFAMRWLMPTAIIGLLVYAGYPVPALVVGGVWALYLIYRLVTFPARRRERKENEKKLQKYEEILELMIITWQYATSEVINPTRLKEMVIKAEDKGASLSPVIDSLLDRAIQRDPAVFIRSGKS